MRRLLLAGFAMMLAACATAPRLETPRIGVTGVQIDRLTPGEARFTVIVTLDNPNDREVGVNALTVDLRIESAEVGRAQLAEPVRLPARGETKARLVARADVAQSLLAARAVAQRLDGGNRIRYSVSGSATLDGGRTIPFSRSGDLAL